jgi:hypothetical protein
MRRKPDSRHGARTEPGMRRPTVASRRSLNSGLARPVRPFMFDGLDVVDDFPQSIPVGQRELDVIETYLSALLDDALGRTE